MVDDPGTEDGPPFEVVQFFLKVPFFLLFSCFQVGVGVWGGIGQIVVYAQSHFRGARINQADVEGEAPMFVIPEGRVPTHSQVGSQAIVGNVEVNRIDFSIVEYLL